MTPEHTHSIGLPRPRVITSPLSGERCIDLPLRYGGTVYHVAVSFVHRDYHGVVSVEMAPEPASHGETVLLLCLASESLWGLAAAAEDRGDMKSACLWDEAFQGLENYRWEWIAALMEDQDDDDDDGDDAAESAAAPVPVLAIVPALLPAPASALVPVG